jgi:hypothetical protein
MSDDDLEKAKLLIESISAALRNGIKHYSRSGEQLMTTKDVLKCLRDEGGFVIGPSDDVANSKGLS